MRVLLLSTYELGHQPLGIAGPAGYLEAAGHEVLVADLAVEPWPAEHVRTAEAAVISIPMHTATQLAIPVLRRLRTERPGLRVALHGLYAPVLAGHDLVEPGDLLVSGDPVPRLLAWLAGDAPGGLATDLGPARQDPAGAMAPRRAGLPPLERYARLRTGGRELVVGSTESSRGCNHRCRHCPVAAVYGGRSRAVPLEAVLADVAQLVAAGAEHISFADPDFLNRPRHAVELARRMRSEGGGVGFDATIKVEHICRHAGIFAELADCGLVFVVSALEAVDDAVLARLDKGHTAADASRAIGIVRAAGVELRPSWLPFTPWTTLSSLADLLVFAARHDLVWSTDPVQYSIRLLLPAGSLLLADPDPVLARSMTGSDPDTGSISWTHADRRVDALQAEIALFVEEGDAVGAPFDETFLGVWRLARQAGADLPAEPPEPDDAARSPIPGPERPRLSEAWFCCAEPTSSQRALVGAGWASEPAAVAVAAPLAR